MVNRCKEMEQDYTRKNSTRHFGQPYLLTNLNFPKNIQVTLSEQNLPPPNKLSILVNNNTNINLEIASYFLDILASPDVLTWFATGGPITKTIKHLGITKHPQKTVERTWNMVNCCK